MRMLIMGPPGAGKGTQALRLAERLRIVAISTGDIFRSNVSDATPLGRVAREYMDAGEYVPDSVTNAMVRARLSEPDCASGFLLDGYPRTLQQVSELDAVLTDARTSLDAVVELVADPETLVGRLTARSRSEGRTDDTAEVIQRRLEVYTEQTAPLIAHYTERGLLCSVDGLGEPHLVEARIADAISARTA